MLAIDTLWWPRQDGPCFFHGVYGLMGPSYVGRIKATPLGEIRGHVEGWTAPHFCSLLTIAEEEIVCM